MGTGPPSIGDARNEREVEGGGGSAADGGPRRVTAEGSSDKRAGRLALPLPAALITLALTYWCVDIVSPALPAMQQALTLTGTGAGLVFACFFGGRLIGNLPAAQLAGRAGPRAAATAGAATLLVGSLLAAVAGGPATLLPARALQGAGIAFLVTAGLLSVLRHRPGGGAAMTAFNVAAGVGGSAGLAAGGWLTGEFGWRSVFWLSAFLGAALLALATIARAGEATPARGGGTAEEVDHASPVRRSALTAALLANLLVYGNYSVWVVSLPLYASERFGSGATELGTLLLVVNFVHLFAAFPAGRAIRRTGAAAALTIGLAVTAAGLALVLAAPAAGWLLPPMMLYAVGQVVGNSAAGDLLLRLGGHGGRAVGMVRFTSDIGLVVGPAAVGVLADAAGVAAPFAVLALVTAGAAVAARWTSSRSGHPLSRGASAP